jgi:hypothetical protein
MVMPLDNNLTCEGEGFKLYGGECLKITYDPEFSPAFQFSQELKHYTKEGADCTHTTMVSPGSEVCTKPAKRSELRGSLTPIGESR